MSTSTKEGGRESGKTLTHRSRKRNREAGKQIDLAPCKSVRSLRGIATALVAITLTLVPDAA